MLSMTILCIKSELDYKRLRIFYIDKIIGYLQVAVQMVWYIRTTEPMSLIKKSEFKSTYDTC